MSAVKGVMEILGSLLEIPIYLRMKTQSSLDDWANFSLNCSLELGEMSGEIGIVDN